MNEIDQINISIDYLIAELDNQLSQNFVTYTICYKGSEYVFDQPLYPHEIPKFERKKKLFIRSILKDALDKLVDHKLYGDYANPWEDVLDLQAREISREQVVSPIAVQAYQTAHEHALGKSIPLNFDSWFVQAQNNILYNDDGEPIETIQVKEDI